MKLLTAQQARALRIVADHPGIRAKQFSEKMWPDSAGHDRLHNCGNRNVAIRGAPMWRTAGAFLAKLVGFGWVRAEDDGPPRYQPSWKITADGLRLLIQFTAPSSPTASRLRTAQPIGTHIQSSHAAVLRAILAGAILRTRVQTDQPAKYVLVGGELASESDDWPHVRPKIVQEMVAWGWLTEHLTMTDAARKRMRAG